MAFTEFYCDAANGSNLNAGSTTSGTAAFTYASGSWVASTGVFTVASGNPSGDGVAVGDFASVYPDGATVGVFVGRVTARDATTITVSLTAKSGTAPTDGTNTRTLKIGGAWKGPNAAEGFPFAFAAGAMMNASSHRLRVNLKNNATYSITAAMTHNLVGFIVFAGYTSSPGDGGRAVIDGGTSGASYVLLTSSSGNGGRWLRRIIFQNNGATGSAAGVVFSGTSGDSIEECVCAHIRGRGFTLTSTQVSRCEAYDCNQSNASGLAGFAVIGTGAVLVRCISHDNAGSNSSGFMLASSSVQAIECVADSNGQYGFFGADLQGLGLIRCDAYSNGSDGAYQPTAAGWGYWLNLESCNFVKNGGYGVNVGNSGSFMVGRIRKCGFGSGTAANTSGQMNNCGDVDTTGNVTYPSNVTPWVDPANGDFRINLAEAKGAGAGDFTQTAPSYAGTVGYPDIGVGQHLESGGGGGTASIFSTPVIRAA